MEFMTNTMGLSRTKRLCPPLVDDLMAPLGVELVLRVNPELEAKMRERRELRDERSVRRHQRLSKKLMDVATSQIYGRLSRIGNKARTAKLPPEARSNIARAAATSRSQRGVRA
jgi:hypothetical protein